ncbi:MAG: hypothetical protein ACLS85_00630 [Coprobacillus cateniformis]
MNRNRNTHIITIEDPIEYLQCDKVSFHNEVYHDTHDYVSASRALYEAPSYFSW